MNGKTWFGWGVVPLALGGLGALGYLIWLALGEPEALLGASNWLYNGSLAMAGVACIVQALNSRAPRGPFLAFGIGLLLWTAGDIYYTEAFAETAARKIPYPSWADAGYLAALPCFFVGIGLLIRRRVGRFTAASWFDGLIGMLAAAALATSLLSPALVGLTEGKVAVVATNLAYPLGDLILISFITGALVVTGIRGASSMLAIGAGLLIWGIGDAYYLYLVSTNTYDGGLVDMIWPVGALVIALGSFVPTRTRDRRQSYRTPIYLPVGFGLIALAVLAWDHYERVEPAGVWLALATIGAVLLRLAAAFRENNRLMSELHRDSVTDSLTGLGNRRALSNALADLAELGGGAEAHVLALYDLDGFKFYNDSFGHPAGDLLLNRLGAALDEAVGSGGAYRLGGDEFCVLAPLGRRSPEELTEVARAALGERGEGFAVSASCGWAILPEEATEPSEALRLVDGRMYADKAGRSVRNVQQMQEIFRRIFRQQDPAMTNHLEGVARLAVAVGRELGMDAEQLDVVGRAAELHDLGKIAMPDEILNKRGPLDPLEWALMHQHTIIGQRILSASPAMRPVAQLVRWSHERWDGRGYPDELAGGQIPVAARLIAICDAFDAMISDRPCQAARSPEDALAELRRCAGAQFDPELVETFCRVVERNVGDEEDPLAGVLGSDRYES
jgi:diguanylate cyclase (GGDEF)-like protein